MRDADFDDRHPKFKKTIWWVFEWLASSTNVVAVRDDDRVLTMARQQSIAQEHAAQQEPSARPIGPTGGGSEVGL